VAKPEDEAYFRSLYQVWELVGINDKVDMGSAYYRRGESFLKRRDYSAASADFERAIALGHTEAVQRRELVVQLQEHIWDEKRKLQEAEEEAKQQALALAKQKEEEETKRQALALAKQKEQAEAKRQALALAKQKQKEENQITINGRVTIELVNIPAGSFMMGSDLSSEEQPIYRVNVNAFRMSKSPITQKQYMAVMGDNPSCFKGDENYPVESVSWYKAVEFCRKLSQMTGQIVRLPSEAEWEYACRAGSTGKYCFGDNENKLGNYGWYSQNSESKTHGVHRKSSNAWGLHDMHGNVWEWCVDTWHENYYGANGGEQEYRSLRGGSFDYDPWDCRSARRGGYFANSQSNNIGFRIVVALPF